MHLAPLAHRPLSRHLFAKHLFAHVLFCLSLALGSSLAHAQTVPSHAEGLHEELISVDLGDGRQQQGVLSLRAGSQAPTRLAVLLPGSPSVVRPVVADGVMQSSRLTGNFLIRARRHLVDAGLATLIVDCHSASGDECSSGYQASRERWRDVEPLIAAVRRQQPEICEVWLVGTSKGTISSSFMALYGGNAVAGAIHTATISEPWAKNSYRELAGFDYRAPTSPQFFIHHRDDPCPLTSYAGIRKIAERFQKPLLTVTGGSDFQGPLCAAQTEHGFKGREPEVMAAIRSIIVTGHAERLDIP
ncbi:alpha/beta hydrolase [Rhodocyclus gracilis]|uniref:Alpha/beta hydrolase n=1 Tax=Rhodocyclus tenuis TaxID=1066 RepID=A0A6L5JVN4_RHOTE|nr:alpha/beta hydrolase [Rhodocyclus gracilis]MQY50610.1 alpha/beta hydrolase [Rhodocyclus gracilis]